MKELKVIGVKEISYESSLTEISALMDRLDKNEINNIPWPEYPYKPSASFTIAYGPDCVFLKYFISEKQIRAANDVPNSPVWQDTCVEFFVSFNDGKQYYNFEINCIGTILAAHGPDREHRDFLPEKTINEIKTFSWIDKLSSAGIIHWDLIAVIPLAAFIHDNITALPGTNARANFYKCGDALNEPHYLSWNEIKAPDPDFHLPAFFGNLYF
jgi:hypothetical protein